MENELDPVKFSQHVATNERKGYFQIIRKSLADGRFRGSIEKAIESSQG